VRVAGGTSKAGFSFCLIERCRHFSAFVTKAGSVGWLPFACSLKPNHPQVKPAGFPDLQFRPGDATIRWEIPPACPADGYGSRYNKVAPPFLFVLASHNFVTEARGARR
jgi:hypothetical protein